MKTIFHFDEFNRTFFLIDDDVFNDRFPTDDIASLRSIKCVSVCLMLDVSKW